MMSVAIVGSGNVGWYFAHAFTRAGYNVEAIYARNIERGQQLAAEIRATFIPLDGPMSCRADLLMLAVSDRAIEEAAAYFGKDFAGIVVHTAGAVPSGALERFRRYGVLYPIQSLSKGHFTPFEQVPLLMTADASVATDLQAVMENAGGSTRAATDAERLAYHLCGVFSNNFTNFMYIVTEEVAQSNGLDFTLLHPLIRRTTEKLDSMSPSAAQTGPAIRGDESTMRKHLQLLSGRPEYQALYQHISRLIGTER